MTILKDWMQDAANEIERQHVELGRMSRVDVPAIIAKHVPFKPDTAYMPIPRCDGCRHWEQFIDGYGDCLRSRNDDAKMESEEDISTAADFGCVQFEEKK